MGIIERWRARSGWRTRRTTANNTHATHTPQRRNSWLRRSPAVLAVMLLAVPASLGVYRHLEPTRGPVAAGIAAAGFELIYLSTALLLLNTELSRYAQRVALTGVAVSIVFNTLADYGERVGATALRSGAVFLLTFDAGALIFSLIDSIPLAALSYAMALLLHRLSEQDAAAPAAPAPVVVSVPTPAEAPAEAPTPTLPQPETENDTSAIDALLRDALSGLEAANDSDAPAADTDDVLARIIEMKANGATWPAIGAAVDMTADRARGVYRRWEERSRKSA